MPIFAGCPSVLRREPSQCSRRTPSMALVVTRRACLRLPGCSQQSIAMLPSRCRFLYLISVVCCRGSSPQHVRQPSVLPAYFGLGRLPSLSMFWAVVSTHSPCPTQKHPALVAGGLLMAQTSLNESGESVIESLDAPGAAALLEQADLILDSRRRPEGRPSTVVRLTAGSWSMLREGSISSADVAAALAEEVP